MLWILLILPAIILARHPSLNPVVVVTKGGCGHHYVCKPASQCSIWYDELRTQSSKPCTDARGYVGLCCPDVVQVRGVLSQYFNDYNVILFFNSFVCVIL